MELTTVAVAALATALAKGKTPEEINTLGVLFTLLGDALAVEAQLCLNRQACTQQPPACS